MTTLNEIKLTSNEVELTASGAKAVEGLLEKRSLSASDYALRLFISGGGCCK